MMAQHSVQSPLPGVFYRRPDPTQPPYVEIGAVVTADQTIGLVEVMKQFAEIKAGVDGVIVSFVAEENSVIGPGDTIATIETA
jgi:acetyl-CoA carboxylase biotin carboxyl carrier protein